MRTIIITCVTALLVVAGASTSAHGYGYGHHGHRHYGHHGHHGGYAGYFVGGLVLGTLLAPPPGVVYVPQPTYVVPRVGYAPWAQAPVGRRLLRDINGSCFEHKIDVYGNELRMQLPVSECAW